MSAVVELDSVFCVHRTGQGDAAALQGATLQVQAGELVGVLGPSGAGKSTLLRVIAGLQMPSAGEVTVLGREMGRLPPRARARLRHEQIGFLPQRSESALVPDLRVREAVTLPLALRGAGRDERRRRADELLEAIGLRDRADAFPAELSGGERQRVALCAALAHRPRLLLADEPTGELDDHSAAAVRGLIADLARALRTSVIVVSHDPQTTTIAGRVLRLRDGRFVEDHRDGLDLLVVGRGGWVRLPSKLLAGAGIGERARAGLVDGKLVLAPAAAPAEQPEPVPETGGLAAPAPATWTPARIGLHGVAAVNGRGARRRRVIDGLTHELGPGRLVAVTGRSGSGKSTLLRLIAGLQRPEAGEVTLDQHRLSSLGAEAVAALRRERIGYMPQEPAPVGFLSAEENVVLVLRVRGWKAPAAQARASLVLARVGLSERARQRVSRLSAGEVQRVALARALAGARGLLVVDEPSSRLDEANAAAVGELLRSAAGADGQTVICATHDEQLIRRADEVLALG